MWLAVCALVGLLCLAVVVWIVATGRAAYLDGLSLALISLAVGAIFLSMVGWSYRSRELKEILKRLKD
jgi:ABC-type enterobactin transport system permease subunit